MTPPICCFLVEYIPRVRRVLRRYQGLYGGTGCGPRQRHESNIDLDVIDQSLAEKKRIVSIKAGDPWTKHPLWPARCQNQGCPVDGGYVFQDGDMGALMLERIGRRSDTGEEVLVSEAPVGSIFDVDFAGGRGDDRRSLMVITPTGPWYLDVADRSGRLWSRTGEGAAITTTLTKGLAFEWKLVGGVLVREEGGVG